MENQFLSQCPASGERSKQGTMRSSNIELFRIVTMLFIVAHHYVVNSGLTAADGPIYADPLHWRSLFLLIFGAWGKIGINCFVMITGYFMCESRITSRKFFKLLWEVMFYFIGVQMIFWITGYDDITLKSVIYTFVPVRSVSDSFEECFLLFYLCIPFINILIQHLTEKQHWYLLVLSGFIYVFFGTFRRVTMNYVSWFIVVYFIASFIRRYPKPLFENKQTVKGTDANTESAPLIYSIDFFQTKGNNYKIKDSITLSLYDTAGENLDKEDSMLCNNQYIANANGIIILLDPLQIPSVRKQLEGKIKLPAQNSDTTEILNRVIKVIRDRKKIKDKSKINIPIALTFTKMDVLIKYDIIPEESALRLQSEHLARGAFVKSDFENTRLEIEGLLENFFADEVIQLLKQFSCYAFFGVSALGENPEGGVNMSGEPNPIRVLDPLLWLLSLNKHIKTI